jgi:hypothetical protein
MFSIFVILLFALSLVGVLVLAREVSTTLGTFLLITFASRIALHWVARNVAFFSHGVGGDALTYEYFAQWIAEQWSAHGFHYMTEADNELIGATSLPPNMFAILIYLNGGQTAPFACTAMVAFAVCITALNCFKLAQELGIERSTATRVLIVLFSTPALLLYSSDMYKDPLVLMFLLGAVAGAIRVSRKFSLVHALITAVCLWALWYVRYYMVFLALLPVAVGIVGLRARGWARPVLSLLLLGGLLFVLRGTRQADNVTTAATGTFNLAVDKNVLDANATGGSGVVFDGGAFNYPLRVIYTLFSPFPWMGGSLGLQLGKIDTLVFYYFIWRAAVATKRLLKTDRATLITLLAFIVPTTASYALTMANMGLMLRQRLPIVAVTAILAMCSWPKKKAKDAKGSAELGSGNGGGKRDPLRGPRPPGRPSTRPDRPVPSRAPARPGLASPVLAKLGPKTPGQAE